MAYFANNEKNCFNLKSFDDITKRFNGKRCKNSCRLHVQYHAVNDAIVNQKLYIYDEIHIYVFESNDLYGYELRNHVRKTYIRDNICRLGYQISLYCILVDVNILQRQILVKPIK